jgi:hypothetical protein
LSVRKQNSLLYKNQKAPCIWCKDIHPDDVAPHIIYRYRKYEQMWCRCVPKPDANNTLNYAQNEHPDVKQKHTRCIKCRKVVKIG